MNVANLPATKTFALSVMYSTIQESLQMATKSEGG